ncbi:hypothetical protein [Intestinimonas sp.]|uniref:hypothetical protein n=1 Tax=Intestinimonas sp. TaxID=1965293 RepID=UPI002611304C|nr:hypothetical protein [Intestinimonas sp.]
MDYANREIEYSSLRDYLLNGATPIWIYTYHASGITSFVKKRIYAFCTSLFGENMFYIDASIGKSLSELLLTCLIQSEHLEELQKFADRKWGEHSDSLLSAALECVPYIGPALGRLAERRAAVPIYTGVYPSAMDELLIQFFGKGEHRFLIVIDTVESLEESSFELLAKLLKTRSVYCILIRTEETPQYDKLENYLFEEGIDFSAHIDFDRPQVKLIKELGALYDIMLSTDEASAIISKTQQNIHAIIKEIRNMKNHSPSLTMTPWEKAIVLILQIWGGPIDEDTLYQIIAMSEVFSENESETFQSTISMLQEKELIEGGPREWLLKGRHNPLLQNIFSQISDQLFYKNIVYEFLSRRNSGQSHAELRYRLSRELNCTTPDDAKTYLHQAIICGKEVPQELMDNAHLEKGRRSDCLLAGIKFCRERRFEEAFAWIDSVSDDEITADIEAFRATLLNRVRRSEEAETALLRAIQNSKDPGQQNLLSSFLISTYIHMERLADAQAVYEERKDLFPDSPMHGYLVRNSTSAYREYREDLYTQALNDFLADHDDFGYYTTLSNQGNALCKTKDYRRALTVLEKARDGLEMFPRSNLHIVYNNLGICYFLLGKYQTAYQYLLLAQRFGRNSMPRIFSTINLACVEAVMGNTDCAIQRLNDIEQEVEFHKLDRVRQKFYVNYLLVESLHGNKTLEGHLAKASAYPDRYFPEHTTHAVLCYQEFMNSGKKLIQHDWRDLYSPCGLAYWYMDPLKLLSKSIV